MPVSADMKTHLAGTVTVAVFMDITAKDGDVIRVWNGTRNKTVDGNIYYAYPLTPSQLRVSDDLKADNLEIQAVFSGLFTSAALRAKKWQGARVVYRTLNYKDFTMGYAERRVMFLGKTTVGKHAAKVEMNTLSSKLNEPFGYTCNAHCDVEEFGNARCGKATTGNTEQGYDIKINATVSGSPTNRQQFSIAFSGNIFPANPAITTAPNGYYSRGVCRFTSGPNNGLDALILTNTGNALTLYLPSPYLPVSGNTLELITGCDRKLSTCRDKFANAINIKAFPFLPGRSKLFKIPD